MLSAHYDREEVSHAIHCVGGHRGRDPDNWDKRGAVGSGSTATCGKHSETGSGISQFVVETVGVGIGGSRNSACCRHHRHSLVPEKIMIARMIMLVLMAGVLLLISCDKQDSHKEAFATGYQQGYAAAIKKLEQQGRNFRSQLRESLSDKLLVFSAIAVILTLFGDNVAERFRNWISRTFHWSKSAQVKAALTAYLALTGFITGWTLCTFGLWEAVPVILLLIGTTYPFIIYIKGLQQDDRNQRRIALTKIKALLFMALVLLMLYQLLYGAGFMGIKISG